MNDSLWSYSSCFALLAAIGCGSAHGGDLFAECKAPDCLLPQTANTSRAGASFGGSTQLSDLEQTGGAQSSNAAVSAGGGVAGALGSAAGTANLAGAVAVGPTPTDDALAMADGGSDVCAKRADGSSGPTLYDGGAVDGRALGCSLALSSPRLGSWTASDDGSAAPGTTASVSARQAAGNHGCYAEGSGLGATNWGGGIRIALGEAASDPCPYDAGSYHGIALSLRGSSTGTQGADYRASDNLVRVNLVTTATSDVGGKCVPSDGKCNDHFGVWCTIGVDWTRCELPLSELRQRGWGAVKRFDPSQIIGLEVLAVRDSKASGPTSWTIAVDDVALY